MSTNVLLAQAQRSGSFTAAIPVPGGASSAVLSAILDGPSIIAPGIELNLALSWSSDHGLSNNERAAIPSWRSGPLNDIPPLAPAAPGVAMNIPPGATDAVCTLELAGQANIGLQIEWF